jgi:hypothetical protein
VAIDHFGNLITNIDSELLTEYLHAGPEKKTQIKIRSITINGLSETYGGVRSNTPLALIGSRGYLEIAINEGNAAQFLKAKKKDPVRVLV